MRIIAKLAASAAFCAIAAAPAVTVSTPADARVVVGVGINLGPTVAPPPVRVERYGPPPRRGWVWRPGRWDWRGGRWVWVGGVWVAPPRFGAVWIPGHWRVGPRGRWVWVEGHWR